VGDPMVRRRTGTRSLPCGRERWLVRAAGLAALIGAAALSSSTCGDGLATGGTLQVAVRADITGLFPNPATQREAYTIDMNRHLFEGLATLDREFRHVPALAERWESPDERTWVFHLRPGVRFSDGRMLEARDVEASLRANLARPVATAAFLHAVESVRAIDPSTVEVRTAFPYPMLLSHLSVGFVLPADVLDREPIPAIGTGPYVVDRWQAGRELVLKANPHHRGPPPEFPKVRLSVVPDPEERVRALLDGHVHLIDNVPLDALPRLRAHSEGALPAEPAGDLPGLPHGPAALLRPAGPGSRGPRPGP
jgi:peptide/nickel transport system substrate-binding protein